MLFNYHIMIKVVGIITATIGVLMVPSLIVSLVYGEDSVVKAFLMSIVPAVIVGVLIIIKMKPLSSSLKLRDGYLIVAASWILVSIIGAFPYMLSGILPSFIDAFFESVAGFTTTSSTIIDELSAIPKGLIFWRSFCHWLGGMGVLILVISILPALGIGGQRIANAEAPWPTLTKISNRMTDSAKILYIMYISFTIVEIILLMLGGMDIFDALIHAFGSMGTGGSSNYQDGVAHFNSLYIELVIVIFSILASINFTLYNNFIRGHWKEFFRDSELRVFLITLGSAIILMMLVLRINGTYDSLGESLRYSIFHSTSFMSTSGYSTTNYTLWPTFCQIILFGLMLIGGCSASTCGSIKVIRIMVLFKLIIRGLYRRLHPNSVVPVKVGGKALSSETVSRISSFLILYFMILIFSSLVLSLDNHDLITTISAAASTLSNTGMGFGLLGPEETFSIFSTPMRLFLSILMIAGRLELFTIMLLFTPSFWNSDR